LEFDVLKCSPYGSFMFPQVPTWLFIIFLISSSRSWVGGGWGKGKKEEEEEQEEGGGGGEN